jgi:hypothetical protein
MHIGNIKYILFMIDVFFNMKKNMPAYSQFWNARRVFLLQKNQEGRQ